MLDAVKTVKFSRFWNKSAALLIIIFLISYSAGRNMVYSNPALYTTFIAKASASYISVFDALGRTLTPISLTALFFYSNRAEFYLVQCFLQTFLYGFVAGAIELLYGSFHWIMRAFMLFRSTITFVLLFWFWLRRSSLCCKQGRADLLICIAISSLASVVDFLFVSPFLSKLLMHLFTKGL